ncbi:hypothetical protein B0T09DRAFT_336798 [Sordaria sp. MPI-SDFR-AT-0083]|nr:hypothetical protein B0T09DRAFT_336798 [Sordaria sp. MPI-SDFR-AT-0083]
MGRSWRQCIEGTLTIVVVVWAILLTTGINTRVRMVHSCAMCLMVAMLALVKLVWRCIWSVENKAAFVFASLGNAPV